MSRMMSSSSSSSSIRTHRRPSATQLLLFLLLLLSSTTTLTNAKLRASSSTTPKQHQRQPRQLQPGVDCSQVVCPAVECNPDETTFRRPDDCCNQCAPTPSCAACPNGFFDGCITCYCDGASASPTSCIYLGPCPLPFDSEPQCYTSAGVPATTTPAIGTATNSPAGSPVDDKADDDALVSCEICEGRDYYDGCNICVCDPVVGALCQQRFCEAWELGEPSCRPVPPPPEEEEDDSEMPSEVPSEMPSEVSSEQPSGGGVDEQEDMIGCATCGGLGFYDGCNSCGCDGDQISVCTMRFCEEWEYEEAFCNTPIVEDMPSEAPSEMPSEVPSEMPSEEPSGTIVGETVGDEKGLNTMVSCATCNGATGFYDGCNDCGCDGDQITFCTLRACAPGTGGDPYCHSTTAPIAVASAKESPTDMPSEEPSTIIIKSEEPSGNGDGDDVIIGCATCGGLGFYDGCNRCGCDGDQISFCTMRFCEPDEYEEAYCNTPIVESEMPSEEPSEMPSEIPSEMPSEIPSEMPSEEPSMFDDVGGGDPKLVDDVFNCLECESGSFFDGCNTCTCSEDENSDEPIIVCEGADFDSDCYSIPQEEEPFCIVDTTIPPPKEKDWCAECIVTGYYNDGCNNCTCSDAGVSTCETTLNCFAQGDPYCREPTLKETVMTLVGRVNDLFDLVERLETMVDAQEDDRLQTCPTEMPDTSQPCNLEYDLTCEYELFCCPGAPPEDCFNTTFVSCNPETDMYMVAVTGVQCPPTCPDTAPSYGDFCSLDSALLACPYDEECCDLTGECINTTTATCGKDVDVPGDYVWTLDRVVLLCEEEDRVQTCPTEMPDTTGTTCNLAYDLTCEYELYCCPGAPPEDCFNTTFVSCDPETDTYLVAVFDVQCPPTCPDTPPVSGDACFEEYFALKCEYDEECCESDPTECASTTGVSCVVDSDTGGFGSYTWVVSTLAGPDCVTDATEEPTCPESEPETLSSCPEELVGTDCEYDWFCCPDGPPETCLWITSASCVDASEDPLSEEPNYVWEVAQAGVYCPTCPDVPQEMGEPCTDPELVCQYDEVCCEATGLCVNTTVTTCSPGEDGYSTIVTMEAMPPVCSDVGPTDETTCPSTQPDAGDSCDPDEFGELSCPYDEFCWTCPNEPETCLNTTFVECDKDSGTYIVAMMGIPPCPDDVDPTDEKTCPATKPDTSGSCDPDEFGDLFCPYDEFCCPDSPDTCFNTTFVECNPDNGEYMVAQAGIQCPDVDPTDEKTCPATKPDTSGNCDPDEFGDLFCAYDEVCCPDSPETCFNTTTIECNPDNGEYRETVSALECPDVDPLEEGCPDTPPGFYEPCDEDGLECAYGEECCPGGTECYNTTFANCMNGEFLVAYQAIECAICPDTPPDFSDPCTDKEIGLVCEYGEVCCETTGECVNTTQAICTDENSFVIIEVDIDCPENDDPLEGPV